jgi:hypothetical protein
MHYIKYHYQELRAMAIIDVHNKKRGVTYVYDSRSYWDKELKQPRSRRKLLGRRDPATGEVVPTRRRGSGKPVPRGTGSAADSATGYKVRFEHCLARLKAREEELAAMRREAVRLKRLLRRISALAGGAGGNA